MNTPSENAQMLQRVLQTTREVFGVPVTMGTSFDPEYPEDVYTVFEVHVSAPPEKIVALEEEWVTRVNKIAPGDLSFCLSLVAVP